MGFFDKLKQGLGKTADKINSVFINKTNIKAFFFCDHLIIAINIILFL